MSWRTVETELLKIITDAVPSTVKVMTADDVAELVDRSQFAPSAQILYTGLTVQDQNAKAVAVTYQFDIAVCMRSASEQGRNGVAKLSATDLSEQLIAALIGRSTSSTTRMPIKLVNSTAPVAAAGYVYIPTSYEVSSVIKATT